MAEGQKRTSDREDPGERLRAVVEGVEAATGEEFFPSLVRALAGALEVEYAFLSELTADRRHFRSVALWGPGGVLPNFEVPLAGSPCEAVLGGRISHHPENLQALFPEDTGLAEWGVVSYAGVPIFDRGGVVTGHVAVLDRRPMPDADQALAIMRIFAARAAAERQRLEVEATLRASETRLSALVDSALDAIVVFDERGRIEVFNPAAEKVFRVSAAEAVGTSVRRFTSPKAGGGPAALEALNRGSQRQVFANAGTVSRRADGEEFDSEATISRVDVSGRMLFMVILRDVEERRRAEENSRRLQRQSDYLEEEIRAAHNFEEIVGRSAALADVLRQADLVAVTDSNVLIMGESGTGKELIARAVHSRSQRRDRPLVKVNCAALPSGLIESELFGHEKGSFTGALGRHIGRFELAHRGTIFLDEIGELPLDVQAKMLRVLQEREFERVGGNQTIEVDVRVIAATNRDLAGLATTGAFRQDLFYRLNVFPLSLPPLRQRREDIPPLVHYFLHRYAAKIGRTVAAVPPATMARLVGYSWPGNVRELENVIERAVILSRGSDLEVDAAALPAAAGDDAMAAAPAETAAEVSDPAPVEMVAPAPSGIRTLRETERQHIVAVLEQTRWRIEGERGAARALGLSPSTLRSRMQRLGIRRSRPRS